LAAEKLSSLLETASGPDGPGAEEFYAGLKAALGDGAQGIPPAEKVWRQLRNGGLVYIKIH
jgi:hypothetical protein